MSISGLHDAESDKHGDVEAVLLVPHQRHAECHTGDQGFSTAVGKVGQNTAD